MNLQGPSYPMMLFLRINTFSVKTDFHLCAQEILPGYGTHDQHSQHHHNFRTLHNFNKYGFHTIFCCKPHIKGSPVWPHLPLQTYYKAEKGRGANKHNIRVFKQVKENYISNYPLLNKDKVICIIKNKKVKKELQIYQ